MRAAALLHNGFAWMWEEPGRRCLPGKVPTTLLFGWPFFRMLCDDATSLIKQTVKDSLNAKTVCNMYAGDIEPRGVDYYLDRVFILGSKLV